MTCPLCGNFASERYPCFALPIYECLSCHHQFAIPGDIEGHTLATYGDDYFFGEGAGYKNYLDESRLLIARGEYYAAILAKHIPIGNVLDVGSAAGFLLRGMMDSGWKGLGVEPNHSLAQYAQEKLGVDSTCSSFESFSSDSEYDVVSMIQVFSHIVDPKSTLAKVNELLHAKGLLLIETWDRTSWIAWLLGRRWHEYSPPSVLHWFTRSRLAELLSDCGFEVIESGHPRRWIQVGHAKSLVRHKYGVLAATSLCWLPSSLQVPYFGDDLIYVLARKK